MSDNERREKYAAALYEFNTEGVWPPDNDRESWLEAADAVTAVADAEQKELRDWLAAAKVLTATQYRENKALREDNQALNDELTEYEKDNQALNDELTATEKVNMWLRNEVSDYSGGLEEAREEIARLEEYEMSNNILRSRLHDQGRVLDTTNKQVTDLKVEIDRLRDQQRKDVEAFRFDRDHLAQELKLTRDLLARTERDLEAQYRSRS